MKRFFTLLGVVCVVLSALAVPRRSALSVAALPDGKLPKDTVVYTFPETNLQKGSISMVIDGEIEGEVIASALIFTTNIVGTYTSEDFYMLGTFVRFPNKPNEGDSTFVDPLDCSAVVSVENGAYHFDISLLGQDSILYRLHMYYPVTSSAVTDTVDIAINNLSIDLSAVSYMNTFFLDGSNNDYTITIACEGTGEDGVYEGASTVSTTITDMAGNMIRSVNTKLTLYTTGGVREADAEVYGNDNKFYRIHLMFTIPTPKKTVEIAFDNRGEGIYYREDGSFYMYNEDLRYIVAMEEIYTDTPEGQYERGDFRPRYTYVGVIEGNDTTGVAMYTASATVTKQGTGYQVDAEILGTDTILYHIRMEVDYRYIAIQYDKTEGKFVQHYTDADQVAFDTRDFQTSGYVSFKALSKTGKLTYLEFYPTAIDPATTLPVGIYPIDSSEATGTVYAGQGVQNNAVVGSVCGDFTSQGLEVPCFFVATGTVKVEAADGKLRLTLDAQNTNGLPIQVTYYKGTTALENATTDTIAVRKIVRDGQVYILYGADTYTTTGVLLNK